MSPVTMGGLGLEVREPTGLDELFVLETPLPAVQAIVALADRVVVRAGTSHPLDWSAVPASSLASVALSVRCAWAGDRVTTSGTCPTCGELFDVSFSLSAYLSHDHPRRPRNVAGPDAQGWYTLRGTSQRLRVPSVADLLAALDDNDAAGALAARCIMPNDGRRAVVARADRALQALSPNPVPYIGGACPACGTEMNMAFDPLTYSLAEFRQLFRGIFQEVHALASAYGWAEATLLAMPRSRRRQYWALVEADRAVL